VRAFTTFHAKLYPIQHAEGRKKRLKESMNHISKKMELINFSWGGGSLAGWIYPKKLNVFFPSLTARGYLGCEATECIGQFKKIAVSRAYGKSIETPCGDHE
jgi:hypothetical protein